MRRCKRALAVLLASMTIASVSIPLPLAAANGNRAKQSSVVAKLAALFKKGFVQEGHVVVLFAL
jgi:hypothetical protein